MSVLITKRVTCNGTLTVTPEELEDETLKLCPISRCYGTVPDSDELQWCMNVYLHGKKGTFSEGWLSVTFVTGRNVNATISLHLDSTDRTHHATFKNEKSHDFNNLQLYDRFLEAANEGRATIHIKIDFDLHFLAMNHRFYESCAHVEKDLMLVVENKKIKVHRHYLALISPVFHAILSHPSMAKSKFLKVADFAVPTVHTVIQLCYGHLFTKIDVPLVIDMLRFIDKYDIKSARIELEAYLDENLTAENFTTIVKYAYTFSREPLMTICGTFYIDNQVDITKLREFVDMDPIIIASVLKTAWKTQNPEAEQVAQNPEPAQDTAAADVNAAADN
uniref:BTB domain-containing protein n=1 Tax=Panagrellus redivivus TaxID=6233 RepID=A0A7E4UWC2_PANRE